MLKGIIFLIGVFVLFMLWFRYFERRSIFFPTKDFSYTPSEFGLRYEDVFFAAGDGARINAWFIHSNKDAPQRLTVLFCHGNGGNISHRISKIEILSQLGLDVFIFDYRGFGRSKGIPSEKGVYLDAEAACDYLTKDKKISADDIIAYGESLGVAAAVDLASKKKLKALILEGAFSSAQDMAREIYPFLPGFLIHSKFNSIAKIKNVAIPKLFIHSSNDEIVPIHLGQKLYNVALEPKSFAVLGGGHNTCFMDSQEKYRDSISSFIGKIFSNNKASIKLD